MLGRLLVKAAGASGVLDVLRPRWRWLAACLGAGLLMHYLYGEYVEHVRLLVDLGAVDTTSGRLSAAFIGKNAAIVLLAVAYLCFEVRLAKRHRTAGTHVDSADVSRGSPSTRTRRREIAEATHESTQPASDAANTAADDGFDFLRHGRKLETRAKEIMQRR